MNSLIFPPYLHEGDRVIILSPSGKIDKAFLKGARKRLESWGLEVVMARHAGGSNGTYAGTIQQRLDDLQYRGLKIIQDPAGFCFGSDGTAYHRGTCRTINRKSVAIDKSEAVERGYAPCSKCGGS